MKSDHDEREMTWVKSACKRRPVLLVTVVLNSIYRMVGKHLKRSTCAKAYTRYEFGHRRNTSRTYAQKKLNKCMNWLKLSAVDIHDRGLHPRRQQQEYQGTWVDSHLRLSRDSAFVGWTSISTELRSISCRIFLLFTQSHFFGTLCLVYLHPSSTS